MEDKEFWNDLEEKYNKWVSKGIIRDFVRDDEE